MLICLGFAETRAERPPAFLVREVTFVLCFSLSTAAGETLEEVPGGVGIAGTDWVESVVEGGCGNWNDSSFIVAVDNEETAPFGGLAV